MRACIYPYVSNHLAIYIYEDMSTHRYVDIDMSDPDQLAALCLRARLECDTKGPSYSHQERRQELSDDQAWAESRRRQLRDSWDT